MANKRPQMGPEGISQTITKHRGDKASPNAMPPTTPSTASAKGDCGCGSGQFANVISAGASPAMMVDTSGSAPLLRPGGGATAGIAAWQSNRKITALWSINENRNSWVHVDGIGWKKLANNSDSAIVALTLLGAHARVKGSIVNYREEGDGMIREMYVWY